MIEIPTRLKALLALDRDLQTMVNASLSEFEPWLEAGGKRPTFFPDYTDHSTQHVEEVLETAVSLIRDEAWEVLSPGDAAVLVLAVLLHDSAMHLTREGFEALVRSGTRWTPITDFDTEEWPRIWADFTLEARRFDQRRLLDLFGDTYPVQVPDLGKLQLDERAKRLIGEFVRRYHPRLAHEIARHGVPGPAEAPLQLYGNSEYADLAGLVARSHGLPARACVPYLKKHFGSRTDPLGVHAVFLIVLLRVADFLQLHASRAPDQGPQDQKPLLVGGMEGTCFGTRP
jgi:molecular chaperone HtpG